MMNSTEIRVTNYIRNGVEIKIETEDKIKEIQNPSECDKWLELVDFGLNLVRKLLLQRLQFRI